MPKQFEVTLTFNFDENTEPEDEAKVMAMTNATLVRYASNRTGFIFGAYLTESNVKEVE